MSLIGWVALSARCGRFDQFALERGRQNSRGA
jgi:hypothetical protein